ncbi:MAG: hypothetical protein ACI8QC_003202 [Planctomycetota bacterium]|jgi:hypothetical protein
MAVTLQVLPNRPVQRMWLAGSLCLLLAVPLRAKAGLQSPGPQSPVVQSPVVQIQRVELLYGGSFIKDPGAGPARPLSWWRSSRGQVLLQGAAGQPGELLTAGADWAEQPLAFPAAQAASVQFQVRISGAGVLVFRDGAGHEARIEVGSPQAEDELVQVDAARLAQAFGAPVVPRLVVRLEGRGAAGARWRAAACSVDLPLPSPADLRADLVQELQWVIELWTKHAADRRGPKHTAYAAAFFDVLSGEALIDLQGQHSVVADLFLGCARAGVPGAAEAHTALARELLTKSLDPNTGLPRRFDCTTDEPIEAGPVEPHTHLAYLVDLAEHGAPGLPDDLRELAATAASRMAATLREHGPQPDGQLSAKFVPSTAAPIGSYPALRRLDVPAALAEVARMEGQAQPPVVIIDALAQLLFTHTWVGEWHEIDPGFDDNFGHYGGRGMQLWQAYPELPLFRELALSGWRYYGPRWRDALRFGGNIAADQVRCWRIFAQAATLDASIVPELAPLLCDGLRMHWKGQQYDGGAWGDVTVKAFDPKAHLQVGDTKGVPQNMVTGFATLYDRRFAEAPGGMPLTELRARFVAVLASTREHYRRPFGYLSTRTEVQGANYCGGEMRLAAGLMDMLHALDLAHPQ